MPMLPVAAASKKIALALFSPLAWRWGPQSWVIAQGFAVAISRARRRMRSAGIPVMWEAQVASLTVWSGPLPSR
ncbi:hypothetical protein HMPREF9607_00722 [Cutibacterium modestum HL044PA1]|uniref:Uncharacterized protein n=1 Tax=Cutibacterium modestum HL044PA1 TaxID=765109 RepID=A0ABN0C779_9ACTN|nr:hypothetical protein HMPREF9607_00722 [Cutibacterium modestum HL044PA1]